MPTTFFWTKTKALKENDANTTRILNTSNLAMKVSTMTIFASADTI